jgi:hypothetical protein
MGVFFGSRITGLVREATKRRLPPVPEGEAAEGDGCDDRFPAPALGGFGTSELGRRRPPRPPRRSRYRSRKVGTYPAGVIGISLNNVGVYGETGAPGNVPDFAAGIYGTGNLQPGIIGFSRDGDGAQGLSFTGNNSWRAGCTSTASRRRL